jgi:hypothetical protein
MVGVANASIRPVTHYQVDLTGTPVQVRLSGLPDGVLLRYLVDSTGGPDQVVYLSGLPESDWLA